MKLHLRSSGTPELSLKHISGAHDAFSARIAEDVGFDAIWVSSLGIAARLGRCDRDEVSWTEHADVAEQIRESVNLPVVLDGADGGGGGNVLRQLARRASQRGLAGLSVEDKAWPRSNSLFGQINLASPDEFASKLKACRDVVSTDEFLLIARTDAFIAGELCEQVVDRAQRYCEAGANAIIVHSKSETAAQMVEFMAAWAGCCPVIAIPTTYCEVTADELDSLGLAAVIWANQLLRSSLLAMRTTASQILRDSLDGKCPGGKESLEEILESVNCGWCGREQSCVL